MRFSTKLRAHALIITLIVSLVVTIICSLLILLLYHQMLIQDRFNTKVKLERNLQSAINLVLADTSYDVGNLSESIDLFEKNSDSSFIKIENWGLYRIGCVEVTKNQETITKDFFFGQLPDGFLSGCLYLTDHHVPLSVSGFTKLEGDAYLPKDGVKPVFVDQKAYAYDKLINGNIEKSIDSLPVIDERLNLSINELTSKREKEREIPDSLIRSFGDSLAFFFKRGPITLSYCRLNGHILISSDSLITINSNCILQNIILSAPIIEFESGFTGVVQAIANDSIIVRPRCRLLYPSSLVIIKRKISKEQPRIVIKDSCEIQGTILTSAKMKDENKTVIEIGRKSTIKGLVYCSGYLSLKGKINGTALTDYFIYKSYPSVYIDYLVDAEINKNAMSKYYIIPRLFNTNKPSQIIQWVH